MAMAGRLGCKVELDQDEYPLRTLFGETAGCLLVEVNPADQQAFESCLADTPCRCLGRVDTGHTVFVISQKNSILSVSLSDLLQAWKGAGGLA